MNVRHCAILAVLGLLPLASVTRADETAPSPQPGQVFRDCPTCPEMVVIPPGVLERNISAGSSVPRRITIAEPFAIGRFEVKRSEYEVFVKATGYGGDKWCEADKEAWDGLTLSWRDPHFRQDDNHPVVCVSWQAVQEYLKWLSEKTGKTYRLPSLPEWEWAAYGGSPAAYPWGDEFDHDKANLDSYAFRHASWREDSRDQWKFTSPVGSFPPNRFGLFDVVGNVEEWLENCPFREKDVPGRQVPADGSGERLTAGGSWDQQAEWARWLGLSGWSEKPVGTIWIGFRVARSL
jgi:formylglycine-generating enzyme required for sulfatase activity